MPLDPEFRKALQEQVRQYGGKLYKEYWYVVRGEFFFYLWVRSPSSKRPHDVRVTTRVKPLVVDEIVHEYLPHSMENVTNAKLLSLRCDGVDSVGGFNIRDHKIDLTAEGSDAIAHELAEQFDADITNFSGRVDSIRDFVELLPSSDSPKVGSVPEHWRLRTTALMAAGDLEEAETILRTVSTQDPAYTMFREMGETSDVDHALSWIKRRRPRSFRWRRG